MDITVLREALPYIKRFKDKVFVIKLGGRVVEDLDALRCLMRDVTLLDLIGVKVVIVHGGGAQANQLLKDLHHESRIVNGRRVTDAKTLEVAKMVYGGSVNVEILSALRNNGARGVGLSGVDADLVTAHKRPPKAMLNRESGEVEQVDFGYVGDIIDVNVGVLDHLLGGGYIPVIACLGADEQGNVYNINADTIAQQVAVKIKAEKLLNMTNVPGIMRDLDDPGSVISLLDVDEAEALLASDTLSAGMIPKVQTCISAVRGGVTRATLLNGTCEDGLLTEVFTQQGHGTMIVSAEEKALIESGVKP
jgi:acetylglutamate kinase